MRKYMSSLFKSTLVGFSVTCSWMHLSWYRLPWSFFSTWLVFVLWLMKFIRIQEQKPEKPVWLSSAVVHVDLYPKRPSHFLREFWLRSLLSHGWGMAADCFALERVKSQPLLGCRSTTGRKKRGVLQAPIHSWDLDFFWIHICFRKHPSVFADWLMIGWWVVWWVGWFGLGISPRLLAVLHTELWDPPVQFCHHILSE